MKKKFYITTPIYYPSGNAHIGHAYCTTMCDIIARYKRMRGVDTYFLTGTDEHGQKIKESALKQGVDPQTFVDNISDSFKSLWKLMGISNDDFIRTTQPRHIEVAQKVFSSMIKNEDVYLGHYEGWYCTPCESFWTETQVGEEHLCPDCGRPVKTSTEESYFFKCQKYVPQLMDVFAKNEKFCYPTNRLNEMVNTFIKPGLNDLSVTRTTLDWGVPVLENTRHTLYVWVDALSNYISALGYKSEDDSLFKKYWEDEDCEIVHVIGADISRFHVIYWPMFLMSLGLRLPDRIFVHGLIMMKDGKMSKSKGNVISPYPLVERYGVDTVRYYLAREVAFGHDGQFTPEQFVERINIDLANNIGNLLNRTVSMINKYFDGIIPTFKTNLNEQDCELDELIDQTINGYETDLNDLNVTDGFVKVMNLVSRANKYIDETTPWALAKDESKTEHLESVMFHLASVLYVSALMLEPVLINKSKLLLDQLGIIGDLREYDSIHNYKNIQNSKVNKKEQLFPRLDLALEVEFIKNLMAK